MAPILLLLLIIIGVPITFICACIIYKRKSKEKQLNKQQQQEGQWRTECNYYTDNETEETTANQPQTLVEENYYHDNDDDVIRYNLNHNHNDDESRIAKNTSDDCYAIPNKQRSINVSTRSTSEVIKTDLPLVDPSYLYAVPDRTKGKKNLEKPRETHDLQSLYTQPNKAMKKEQVDYAEQEQGSKIYEPSINSEDTG